MSPQVRQPHELYDLAEVERASRELDRAMLLRLRTAAGTLFYGLRLDSATRGPEDLVSEAITRTLSGDRRWRRGIGFDYHLIQTMRSIASDWRRRESPEAARKRREIDRIASQDSLSEEDMDKLFSLSDTPSGDPDALNVMIASARVEALKKHFAREGRAREVIACLELEMSGEEIREQTGMTRREFVTTMQRIRRQARRREDAE